MKGVSMNATTALTIGIAFVVVYLVSRKRSGKDRHK